MAVVSAILSIAPFTPAVVLTVFTMPAAVIATWLGAWRLGVFSFSWSLLAIIAFPPVTPSPLEAYVGLAYPLALALGIALYLHYRHESATHCSRSM